MGFGILDNYFGFGCTLVFKTNEETIKKVHVCAPFALVFSREIDFGKDEMWLEILALLEYLDPNHKVLLKNYSSKNRPSGKMQNEYLERFSANDM